MLVDVTKDERRRNGGLVLSFYRIENSSFRLRELPIITLEVLEVLEEVASAKSCGLGAICGFEIRDGKMI